MYPRTFSCCPKFVPPLSPEQPGGLGSTSYKLGDPSTRDCSMLLTGARALSEEGETINFVLCLYFLILNKMS